MASKPVTKAEKKVEGSKPPRTETYTYSAGSYRTKSYEDDLFELVQLSDVPLDKELSKEILELLKMNIAPAAILQVLKMLKSRASTDGNATQDQPVKVSDQDQVSVTPCEKVTQSDRETKSSRSKSGRASDKIRSSSSKRSSEHKSSRHGRGHRGTKTESSGTS